MQVKKVKRIGSAMVVQYLDVKDGTKRVMVPAELVVNDDVPMKELRRGVPYGLPWEDVLQGIEVTPYDLATELRRHGIWTLEDVLNNTQVVQGCIQKVAGTAVAYIISSAKLYQQELDRKNDEAAVEVESEPEPETDQEPLPFEDDGPKDEQEV